MPLRPKTKRLLPENKVNKKRKQNRQHKNNKKKVPRKQTRPLPDTHNHIRFSYHITSKINVKFAKNTSLPKQRGCCRGVNGDFNRQQCSKETASRLLLRAGVVSYSGCGFIRYCYHNTILRKTPANQLFLIFQHAFFFQNKTRFFYIILHAYTCRILPQKMIKYS